MGCHYQVTGVTIDDWRWKLCIRMHSTVNTVTYSYKVRGQTDCHILAFINWACFIDGCNHNCAVIAIAYLHKLNIRVDINVRIFATLYPDILVLNGWLFYGHTLVQSVHVNDLSFRFMWRDNLTQPVNYDIHVDFNRVASSLEEWGQSWKLDGTTARLETTCLLYFEENPQCIELRGAQRGFWAVDVRGD